jgi:alpha-L-arabinofuranosidase
MPPYYAQRLLSEDHLPLRIAATTEGGLDVVAAKSEDGKTMVLTVVNVADHPIATSISLGPFRARLVHAKTVHGSPSESNSSTHPKDVSPQELQVKLLPDSADLTLPALSLTSVRFSR